MKSFKYNQNSNLPMFVSVSVSPPISTPTHSIPAHLHFGQEGGGSIVFLSRKGKRFQHKSSIRSHLFRPSSSWGSLVSWFSTAEDDRRQRWRPGRQSDTQSALVFFFLLVCCRSAWILPDRKATAPGKARGRDEGVGNLTFSLFQFHLQLWSV